MENSQARLTTELTTDLSGFAASTRFAEELKAVVFMEFQQFLRDTMQSLTDSVRKAMDEFETKSRNTVGLLDTRLLVLETTVTNLRQDLNQAASWVSHSEAELEQVRGKVDRDYPDLLRMSQECKDFSQAVKELQQTVTARANTDCQLGSGGSQIDQLAKSVQVLQKKTEATDHILGQLAELRARLHSGKELDELYSGNQKVVSDLEILKRRVNCLKIERRYQPQKTEFSRGEESSHRV